MRRLWNWLDRWAWTIPALTLCGFAVIIGGFILAVNHLDRHIGAEYLDTSVTNGSTPAVKAASDGLPAPPAINSGGETTRTVTTKTAPQTKTAQQGSRTSHGTSTTPQGTSTTASRQVSVPVGKPVNQAAKLASDYAHGLLKAPAGPGTMKDVELQVISFAYLFHGDTEYVYETLSLRNIVGYPMKSLDVPLLPGAYSAHIDSLGLPGTSPAPILTVTKDSVVVPVSIPPDSGWGFVIHVGYRVPDNFDATQSWTMPTLSMQGLWVDLYPGQSYLTVSGAGFHIAPGLQAQAGPGAVVWASTGNYSLTQYSPVKAGTVLSWKIVPSNPKTYPGYVYPPSGNVLGPAASANPCTNCGGGN